MTAYGKLDHVCGGLCPTTAPALVSTDNPPIVQQFEKMNDTPQIPLAWARTSQDMDGTLTLIFDKSESSRNIKKW